jgi:hypothetical protein
MNCPSITIISIHKMLVTMLLRLIMVRKRTNIKQDLIVITTRPENEMCYLK